MTEPNPHACVVCSKRIPNRPPVCDGDRTALDSMLGEIPTLFARLDPTPGKAKSKSERVSGTPEIPIPVNLDIIDLTLAHRPGSIGVRMGYDHKEGIDWGRYGGDPMQIGDLPVATELDFWVQDWRSELYPDHSLPVPTVAVLAGWLRNRLERACDEHPAIDEFAAKVKQIHRALTRQIGESKRTGERVGKCPAILRDDTRCATTLYVDPYVSQIACTRCRTSWPTWLHLMAALEDTEDESEGAAA